MKKIIHLTDLHIGYGDLRNKFSELISNLVYSMQPAGNYVVVITGDLVENATPKKNFHRASEMLKTLKNAGYDVLVVPGNHDYGTGVIAGRKNMKSFKKNFYGSESATFPRVDIITDPGDSTTIAFIGLDSMAGGFDDKYPRALAQGDLGKAQRDELDKILASPGVISADKRVIYLHHHPIDRTVAMKLNDAEKLARVLKRHTIDALLFGHKHEGKKWNPRWGITRLYDGGTSTGKAGDPWRHRVIDLTQDPRMDYDGDFL